MEKATLKKRPITLIELLISLSLMGILLTLLFGFFMQSKKTEAKFIQAEQITAQREHIQVKLCHALSQIVPNRQNSTKSKEPASSLYVDSENALHMYFDNGIDPNPKLSGPVLGKLWINDQNDLLFSISSLDEDPETRTETLYQRVGEIKYSFLGKSDPQNKKLPQKVSSWPAEQNQLPVMLQVHLYQENDEPTCSFAFFLPGGGSFITYFGDKS